MKNIGNSILPSCSPEILIPMGDLRVIRDEQADTHRLLKGGEVVASHPNGFSCHSLAKRMATSDKEGASKQAHYIIACGGTVNFALL